MMLLCGEVQISGSICEGRESLNHSSYTYLILDDESVFFYSNLAELLPQSPGWGVLENLKFCSHQLSDGTIVLVTIVR